MKITVEYDVKCPKCKGIWDIGKVSGTYKILKKEISWKNHENLHQ